jgi:transcriptional regulator with XRE-family HTH domain
VFAERYQKAGEAWDVAFQIAALRNEAGMSQAELAKEVRTTQQQISRLESPSYEGHSLSMLRRVAEVLGAKVYVQIQRSEPSRKAAVAESKTRYGKNT